MNTEIIPRTTLTMLAAAWRESEAEIRQAEFLAGRQAEQDALVISSNF